MKALILTLAMTTFALPAFAQSSDNARPMTTEKLKTQLSNAGFKQVKVLDTTYLVQAQTQDGDKILMMINPPANMSETTSSTTQGTDNQNQNSNAQ